MKRIINSKMYDTAKSEVIIDYKDWTLYKTKTGNFFLYHKIINRLLYVDISCLFHLCKESNFSPEYISNNYSKIARTIYKKYQTGPTTDFTVYHDNSTNTFYYVKVELNRYTYGTLSVRSVLNWVEENNIDINLISKYIEIEEA